MIISFDGLNRSGKGTQLLMLKDYLIEKGYLDVEIMRGDGSRQGLGRVGDSYSEWWQKINPALRISRDSKEWDIAYRMLNQELYHKIHSYDGVILLDRSIISRYFVVSRDCSLVSANDILQFEGVDGIVRDTILPTLAFVLHVPKDVLLERNEVISDQPEKTEFRKSIIQLYYDDFETSSKRFENPFIDLVHVDGDREIYEVHLDVVREVERYV